MESLKFVDLFAGMGGFHRALSVLDHECVFASEVDDELRGLYLQNFPQMAGRIFGDIRTSKSKIPNHDILCAGFPCQPFSKSGGQRGTKDQTRGTLFGEILDVLERKLPRIVLLENVGNFGRHDGGRTWDLVQQSLTTLGYDVAGTEHRTPRPTADWRDVGGPSARKDGPNRNLPDARPTGVGLVSPHHFGYPHHRDRFFIIATLGTLPDPPFPELGLRPATNLDDIVQSVSELTVKDRDETRLSDRQRACIDHWNRLVRALPPSLEPPSFPLWGDELRARYPFEDRTPWATRPALLGASLMPRPAKYTRKQALMAMLPPYAQDETPTFRQWKVKYIRQNRLWWA